MWDPWAELLESRERGQAFISERYFHLLRNYRRHGWIVLYLFGVSPVVCNSFLRGRNVTLPRLSRDTSYEPYATSLRMSDLGYRNRNQSGLSVSVNSLEEYVRDLTRAISTPHEPYEKLGVHVDGEWRQLNANILQIENEYYSFIRPKRVARTGEKPTRALLRGGVEYVEVRALDVSAFDPVGVNQNKLRFLEVFLALCLMKDSPPIATWEHDVLDANHVTVARRGREPGLTLKRDGRDVSMRTWARELLDSMQGIAEILDAGDAARPYSAALAAQAAKIDDVARTPSARMLKELEITGESFFDLALRMSRLHKEYFLALYAPNVGRQAEFRAAADESLGAQAAIEARDAKSGKSFEQYLAEYAAG
jgi:glutamate--cysteine ligase